MAALKNCEITKALNDLSSDSSTDDSDFDDIISNSNSINQVTTLDSINNADKQKESVRRLPTRRPDPNVSNRNALLARENRRKKKAYVETLEKELDAMKSKNKKMYKLLKKQMKAVKKLEHEKQYYKGLLSNQSDIFNIVSVLNTKMSPRSTCTMSPKASSCSPNDSIRSTCSFEPASMQFGANENENDSTYEPYSETNWDQLLGLNDDHILADEECASCTTNSAFEVPTSISGEHNYFTNPPSCNVKENDDSGLCLHIARGKISVEYCPSCHTNAKRFTSLPDELLVN